MVCPDENGMRKLTGVVSFGYAGCTDAGVYTKFLIMKNGFKKE